MLVYGFIGDESRFIEIDDSLRSMQNFVGGLIEKVGLTPHIDLICNEEGLINGSEPRVMLTEDGQFQNCIIMGDCFVCRHDGKGNFESIKETDLPIIKNRLFHLKGDELKMLGILFLLSCSEEEER